MNNAMIEARDLTFRYETGMADAVSRLSLRIEKGEFVAILGRNGCGKSTLAKLMNALLMPTSGTITVDGKQAKSEDDCYEVRRSCGMVFQNPDNQIVTTIVEEDCAFGLENLGVEPGLIRRRVDESLAAVGMADHAKSSPAMLSGGQKQRVAVAGVLAMRPKIIVFDESTAMLDPVGRRDVFGLAKKLNREEGITIVWITHFMEEAALSDRVLVMDQGRIALEDTPRRVFSQMGRVLSLGLDVPEMMKLGAKLRGQGVKAPLDAMTVDEMAEALKRQPRKPAEHLKPEAEPAEPDGKPIIEIRHLTHVYMAGSPFESKALDDVSLTIHAGEFIGIIGHTGSGKSTLISYFNGLTPCGPGTVFVNGVDLGDKGADLIAIRRTVGLVFQYPEYQLFEETVAKDIAFGPSNLGLSPDEIEKRVVRAMHLVGLDAAKAKLSPFELSGGQKRRVAIAGVLAMQPQILVLDEPAAGLDPAGRHEMLQLIRDIHQSGVTIVMVSHSMDDVGTYCDRLLVLDHGRVAHSGAPSKVFHQDAALRQIGLDVPECARLAGKLRSDGFDIPHDLFKPEDVARAIADNIGKGGHA